MRASSLQLTAKNQCGIGNAEHWPPFLVEGSMTTNRLSSKVTLLIAQIICICVHFFQTQIFDTVYFYVKINISIN